MLKHKIEWRKDVTVAQYNSVIRGDFVDESKPFPFEDWIVSVDGIDMEAVDGWTRLEMMPEVFFMFRGLQDSWLKSSGQDTNGDGRSSSESDLAISENSGAT